MDTESSGLLKAFMEGFAGAASLLTRAAQRGFFIEYVCLAAAVVDGTLRIGLVLEHQLRTRSIEVPPALLYQGDDARTTSERSIYRMALQREVIEQNLFDELQALYDRRNRVIHRYIISDMTTVRVTEIAKAYGEIIPKVSRAVWVLEDRQIREGVGMTIPDHGPKSSRKEILSFGEPKHGDTDLARRLLDDIGEQSEDDEIG